MPYTPDGIEVGRLTTTRGRILITVYHDQERNAYDYRGDGCGGFGLSLETIRQRIAGARTWPGGKTAKWTGGDL